MHFIYRQLGLALIFGALLVSAGCVGTATIGDDDDDDTAGAGDDDSTPGGDDDTAGAGDDDSTPGGDDDDDRPRFEGITGAFFLVAGVHHPAGRGTSGWGYFVRELNGNNFANEAEAAMPGSHTPLGGSNSSRGPRGLDHGCEVALPENDRFGQNGQDDYETLDAGPVAEFSRGQRVWELPHYEIDGEHYYWAGPDQNPSQLPPASLRFEVEGGPDVPGMELGNAMPTVGDFSVARPGLPTGEEILRIGTGNSLQFAWTPEGQDGVELVVRFEEQDQGLGWAINCWVQDNGSFEVEASLLSQMPPNIEGETWIRRYETRHTEASEDNAEMWFSGGFQHHWTIVLESESAPAPDPAPGH